MAPLIQQASQDARRADEAVVRVGAVKQLVEQEQQRRRSTRHVGDLANARDLRVESRPAFLQRVLDAQRRADGERREPQRVRTHRRTREREHGVDADRSQQRALAGHVRAADDEQLRRR